MAMTDFAENVSSRSRSDAGVEIAEVWNWGWSEHVKLTNTSNQPALIGGWKLGAIKEGRVFQFPPGFSLSPGAEVLIHTGANATVKQDPPSDLFWDSAPVWANRKDMAILFDATGKEQARLVYQIHGEPNLDATPQKRLVEDAFGYQIVDA